MRRIDCLGRMCHVLRWGKDDDGVMKVGAGERGLWDCELLVVQAHVG